MNSSSTHRSQVEIDLSAFQRNIRVFAGWVGGVEKVFPVIKADAYGHGMVQCARAAQAAGCERFLIAGCAEAKELRDAGFDGKLQLLGTLAGAECGPVVDLDVTATVCSVDQAQRLNDTARRREAAVPVHIKLDTGMGRLGLSGQHVMDEIGQIMGLSNLTVEGMFTHLGQAESSAVSEHQIKRFTSVCDAAGIDYRHVCNTTGTVLYPHAHGCGVRVGLGLYGMYEPAELHQTLPVEPVLRWTTSVHEINQLPSGTPLGYGGSYLTRRDSRIGVLPVGYADGYPRAVSNSAEVLVAGQRAPVVGRVSMGYTLIDLTEMPQVRIGEAVTLIGTDGDDRITTEELAACAETIPYCITTGITARVERRVVRS